MKEKVYENRFNKPLENERELKKRIESVWKDTACNLPAIQRSLKQFVGRLRTVKKEKANISK